MSYDVELVIDTGGEYPATVTECRSPTYNLAPMFREALGIPMSAHADSGGGHLDGMLARDALPILNRAIERMCSEPDRFRALNPPNGWGSYEGALEFLRWLREQCENHPKATVRV